jgi:hypothetical protein
MGSFSRRKQFSVCKSKVGAKHLLVLEKELRGSSSDELTDGASWLRRLNVWFRKSGVGESFAVVAKLWIMGWQMDQNITQDQGFDDDSYADLEDSLVVG